MPEGKLWFINQVTGSGANRTGAGQLPSQPGAEVRRF